MKPLLLLAGGRSMRMGVLKGLIEVGGKLWLEHQAEKFAKVGGTHLSVVLGFGAQDYLGKIADLNRAVHAPVNWKGLVVRTVVNVDPERGQFSSIQTGIVSDDFSEGVFILPIDVPVPKKEVWATLESSLTGELSAVQPVHGGRGGHPLLVRGDFTTAIRNENPANGRLDALLHALPPIRLARIQVSDPAVLFNLNEPSDWASALNQI